jgi:hypothetical protein
MLTYCCRIYFENDTTSTTTSTTTTLALSSATTITTESTTTKSSTTSTTLVLSSEKSTTTSTTTSTTLVPSTISTNSGTSHSDLCYMGDDIYPDKTSNCRKYYICVFTGTHHAAIIYYSCSNGTLFDTLTKNCNWAHAVTC